MVQPVAQPAAPAQYADGQLLSLKVPPHSVEAEQSVLGGLLLDNAAWDKIGDAISVSDFYRDDHRRIFRHIAKLIEQGKPADVLTVAESIESSEDKGSTGGLTYLGQLAQNTPSAHNIRRYAEIVRERAIMRRLVAVGNEIADSAFNQAGREVSQLLDEAESKVFQIAEAGLRTRGGFHDIHQLLSQVMERVDFLYSRENPSEVTGIPTGYKDLDSMTSGFQEGDLVIIAGRPSMGKAQPLDARVKTRDGWKLMGELKLGDELASIDGARSLVSGIFPQGPRQTYRITFSDGRSTRCCAEHLWRVYYREWDAPRVVSTERLIAMVGTARYRHRLWVDVVDGHFGHSQPLPLDPWLLGALLGDGHLDGGSVMFSTADEEMLEHVLVGAGAGFELRAAGGYDYRLMQAGGAHRKGVQGVSRNGIKESLKALGLWGLKSEEKFIPPSYLLAGRNVRLQVLNGLLDTDGWVEKWGSIRFCSTSERLARDVVELVRSVGGWATVRRKRTTYTYEGQRCEGRPAYVCNIHHSNPRSLLRLRAKVARLPERPERAWRPVIASIEPDAVTQTQCISVTHPSSLYVTDDYVVTHNTAFALNIGEHVAVHEKKPVAVFSMEMSGTQIAARMLGSLARIDQHKLRTGRLSDEDWNRLADGLGKLHDAPLFIDETPALNPLELRARARRLARQHGKLGLVIVDYLQLMTTEGRRDENRATELSEISRSLKGLAKELAVPVAALSQLNRGVDQRNDKRPIMSDLRESGALEQDADVILFIYRDEVYNRDTAEKGKAEIIIGKQRNGPIGTVDLTFLGQYTRFESYARPVGQF
jgi:replicative DNA helicase